MPVRRKVLQAFLFHHLELAREERRISEVVNHMPTFHIVTGIAIWTPTVQPMTIFIF